MTRIDELFARLDQWRHLPAYQLERRADVFFALYLHEVLAAHTGLDLDEVVIPEFPIKRDLIWPEHPTSKSLKVDYVLFTKDRSEAIFVELKTDPASRREAQDDYLARSRELGLRPVVAGIREILLATTAHQKYHHLAEELAALGFLELPDDLESFVFPTPRRGLTERLEAIRVPEFECGVRVVYVQPVGEREDEIGFEQFASVVERDADPLACVFAAHLRRWVTPAGSTA